MKNEISSLELYYLINELQILKDSKVDRIFHSKNSSRELVIGFHISGTGKKFLRTILPSIIFLDEGKDTADTPTGLCMMLRKYLEGSRLKGISQIGFERIIELILEKKVEDKLIKYYLIIELFSKGNIIFCDEKYKILNLLETQHWKDRELKKDEIYIYPKAQFNVAELSLEEFFDRVKNSNKESLVKTLAIVLSLGGTFAEEICLNSKVDKNIKVKDLSDKDFDILYKNFKKLFNNKTNANFVDENIFPFELKSFDNKDKKTYDSFSEAIRENYSKIKVLKDNTVHNKNIEKIASVIDDQNKILLECQQSYEENQAKGEILYEKYQEVKQIVDTVKEARKKYSWKEIKQKIDNSSDIKKFVKDIDEKNSEIIIEIKK
jgi:predicted ribosome quality control (RQC) complex YloA/Tae2 family protein